MFYLQFQFSEDGIFNSKVIADLEKCKSRADIVISNRMSAELEDVESKVYTKSLFGGDS